MPGLGAYRFNIIHPDPSVRANHVEQVCIWVERAAAAGIATVENVSGRGIQLSAMDTHQEARTTSHGLTSSIVPEQICDACRGTGVRFVLEPCIATLLDSSNRP